MRRKLILAIALVLLIAVPGSPMLIGWQTQQAYSEMAEQVTADNPDVTMRIDDYERGWLTSRVAYTIELDGPWGDFYRHATDTEDTPRITGRDRVRHGPWVGGGFAMARIDSSFRVREALEALGLPDLAHQSILDARSRLDFAGDLDSRFQLPDHRIEFETAGDNGEPIPMAIEWRDAGGSGGVVGNLTQFRLAVPEITIQGAGDDHMVLRNLELGDRSRRAPDGLWLGRTHFGFAAMDIQATADDAPNRVELRGFTARAETDADEQHAETQARIGFDRFTANGDAMHDGELYARLERLDRPAFARLIELTNHARHQGEINDQLDAQLTGAVAALLQGSPELSEMHLRVGTEDGVIEGDLGLAFDGNRDFRLDMPITLLDPLAGQLTLRVPTALARRSLYASMADQLPKDEFSGEMDQRLQQQVDQSINLLVGMGLIERDGNDLVLRADKETGGPPLVNGQNIMAMIEALGGMVE